MRAMTPSPATDGSPGPSQAARLGRRLLSAILCVGAAGFAGGITRPAPALAEDEGLLLWMDNSITGLAGAGFAVDPGDQYTATLEHASGWSFGDLFIFVDFTRFQNKADNGNSWTWYGEVTPRLSFGKITNSDLSFGIVKDVLIAMTYERGRHEEVTESLLLGLGFDLDLNSLGIFGDEGFNYVQLNVYARNELNDGAGDDPDRGFKDLQLTLSASYPFEVEGAAFLIDGFVDFVAGFGPQEMNVHVVPQFKLDIGNFFDKPKFLYAGVELDYWMNKYGLRDSSAFETDQLAVSGLVKVHF